MEPWTFFFGAAVVVMVLIYPLYVRNRDSRWPVLMAGIKGLGTLIAAGVAFVGYLRMPDTASFLLSLGLLACAAADIALNFHFPAGTVVFLAGHLLYLSAMASLAPPRPVSLVLFLLSAAAVVLLFLPELRRLGKKAGLYLLYGAVQLLMLALALGLPASLGMRGMAAAAGALLFALSDIVLAGGLTRGSTKKRRYAVMGLYYSAQLVLSLAALQPWL